MLAPSLHRALFDAIERYPEGRAVGDSTGPRTYQELGQKVLRTAAMLARSGVRPGDRVVFSLPNSSEFLALHFGILTAGGISVPCEHRLPSDMLAHIIRETDARAVVVTAEIASRYTPPPSVAAYVTGPATGCFESLEECVTAERSDGATSPRAGSDPAVILFTTGTTARAKGVVLAHEQTLFTLNNLIKHFQYSPETREVVVLTLSHSFGLGHAYCNLFSGGYVHLEQGLVNLKRVLRALEEIRATGFPGTPAGFGLLLDRAPSLLASACADLRFIVINSAALPPDRTTALQALLPHVDINVYYGLTEASRTTLVSLTKEGPRRYRSVGPPMPGVEIRIAPVTSEVLIRGPHVARDYWNDPAGTAARFTDGWLHSGDVGELGDDGMLYLKGRLHDQINVDGYKVAPEELDQLIRESGLVADGAAFAWNDPARGTTVVAAAIVPLSGTRFDERALTQYCVDRLAAYKVPARWFCVDSLPKAESGKLLRSQLVAAVSRKAE